MLIVSNWLINHRFICRANYHTEIVCYENSEYMDVSHLSFIILFVYWSQLWLEHPLVFFPCSFSTGSLILDTKPCHCPLWLYCWRTMRWDLLLMLRARLTHRHLTLLPTRHTFWAGFTAGLQLVLCRHSFLQTTQSFCSFFYLHFTSKTTFLYLQTTLSVQKHWLERIWNTMLVQSWDMWPLVWNTFADT